MNIKFYFKYFLNITLFLVSIPIYFGINLELIDQISSQENSVFSIVFFSICIYVYLPIVPFLFKFSFNERRLFYITQLRKNYRKISILILIFIFLSVIINILFGFDSADGYQEREGLVFLNLSSWLLYTILFILFYLKYLKSNESIEKFRVYFFKSIFYVSLTISIFSLICISSCADNPGFLILLSLISLFTCTLISLVDLIISLFKNYFNYFLLIYPIIFSFSIYGFFQLQKIYGHDGRCNLIFGPDDSGMLVTFISITLYSFFTKKI